MTRRLSRRALLAASAAGVLAACGQAVALPSAVGDAPAAPLAAGAVLVSVDRDVVGQSPTPGVTVTEESSTAERTTPLDAATAPGPVHGDAVAQSPTPRIAENEEPLTAERAVTLEIPRRSREIRNAAIIADVPRDAIPPLTNPKYETAFDAGLPDSEIVLGFEWNNDARAYPVRIMNWHEIVNDRIGQRDVVVTYCPLCRSAIVFDAHLQDGSKLTFGNTGALYESAMVMYDLETESDWWQAAGEAIRGPLKGAYLETLPSLITTWGEWSALFPNSRVLSTSTGHIRDYSVDYFARYGASVDGRPSWPVSVQDGRLSPKEVVLGVVGETESVAYSITRLGSNAVLHDTLDRRPVVVFSGAGGGQVFEATLDGEPVEFAFRDGAFRDKRAGSSWDLAGRAVDGPHKGRELLPVDSYSMFWFAWFTFQPDTRVAP